MNVFLEDLKSGEIQMRDRFQFELKSNFYPKSGSIDNLYTQEFYFFVPNVLMINPETYTKADFYGDLTNFIRLKTPEFTIEDLALPEGKRNPFFILENTKLSIQDTEIELKLLGNIIRSALRERVAFLLTLNEASDEKIEKLSQDVSQIRANFNALLSRLQKVETTASYVDEFISNSIDFYLTGYLNELRNRNSAISQKADDALCRLILEERHRISLKRSHKGSAEEVLYRSSLLKKFVMDALLLPVNRSSIQERWGGAIASFAAGIAMFAYLLLFVWQGSIFVINSIPFIAITVVAYILKDRLKDALKTLSYQHAFYWFSDFTTEVQSPDEKYILGEMKESFIYTKLDKIPTEIKEMRLRDFHIILETYKRPEQILYLKREVKMFSLSEKNLRGCSALNIFMRFHLENFLERADDPYHDYISLDPTTHVLMHTDLPKVYHLNIILKNSYEDQEGQKKVEIKKFRLILDKNGIKQIEHVH
ncbi:MAG: hypothetical protein ACK5MA_08350 [Parachlamydiaceae bacterium]